MLDLEFIARKYTEFEDKKRKRFLENLYMLFEQELMSLSLRGPYRIILDSNILMRIENLSANNKDINEGELAVLFFFNYLKEVDYHVDLVIQPSVFYEYCHLRNHDSLASHWESFKSLKDSIEKVLNIKVLFMPQISNYSQARRIIEIIRSDSEKIKEELVNIKNKDWLYIRDPIPSTTPWFIAGEFINPITTKYFSKSVIGFFLRDHIAYSLINHPDNNFKFHDEGEEYLLRKILYIKGGNLRGLADLELFTLCNIRSQFNLQSNDQYHVACIPLTIDKDLHHGLEKYSNFGVSSGPLIGGVGTESDNRAKLDSFYDDVKRMDEAKLRQQECIKRQHLFLKNFGTLIAN